MSDRLPSDRPRKHFLNTELLDYFDDNRSVDLRCVESGLPRELEAMSF